MISSCDHNSKSIAIHCLDLAISLICDDCGATVKSRKLTEEEINKLIKKELKRYGN